MISFAEAYRSGLLLFIIPYRPQTYVKTLGHVADGPQSDPDLEGAIFPA